MDQTRIERLKRYQNEGTLVRRRWTGTDSHGREVACLLFALAPEVGPEGDIEACPASVMPQWLAYLTLRIDDAPSDAAWPEIIMRYADLASRWNVLSPEDWTRLEYAVRGVCVEEAMKHTDDEKALKVCASVVDLCKRTARGERVEIKTWKEAQVMALAAETTAQAAGARNAEAANATAAWAAASANTTEAARSAAAWATWAGRAGVPAKAWAAAADGVVTAILDTIEQALKEKC